MNYVMIGLEITMIVLLVVTTVMTILTYLRYRRNRILRDKKQAEVYELEFELLDKIEALRREGKL